MRLAMRLPEKKGTDQTANDVDVDPREKESADLIDLASRTAYPGVTQRKGKSDALGLAAGIAAVAAIGGITLWSMNSTRLSEPEGVGNPQVAPPAQANAAQQPVTVDPAAQAVKAPQNAAGVVRRDPAPAAVLARSPSVLPVASANPYASPTIVFDAGGSAVSIAPAVGPVADTAPNGATAGGTASDFASRIGGVGGGPATATVMINPQTTVTQGTMIPAILETAIDTDVPGYVRAVVSQDVRSHDGARVLIPRSSRLVGQYQSGVQAGQKRAYVIWQRLITPEGASVNIASPAVGFDGTTGLEGRVNNRFFQRFGSAMLLSVIGGLSAIGTGGASVVIGGGGQAAAAAAVQQDSQIGPTIRVRMGEPIRVFTARDLDFSQVVTG